MPTRLRILGCLLVVAVGLILAPAARAANVYEDYSKVGSVARSYGDRFTVKADYSSIGYVKRSYGNRWNVYESYSRIGYVKRSYGGRWDIYSGYSKVGTSSAATARRGASARATPRSARCAARSPAAPPAAQPFCSFWADSLKTACRALSARHLLLSSREGWQSGRMHRS